MQPPQWIWQGGLAVPLRVLLRNVADSFWFLPGLLVLGSLGLAWLTVSADGVSWIASHVPGPHMSVTGARAVLSTIAGAVMTVGGVVFSLTFVAFSRCSCIIISKSRAIFVRVASASAYSSPRMNNSNW